MALAAAGQRLLVYAEDPAGGLDTVRGVDLLSGRELWRHDTQSRGGRYLFRVDPTGRWTAMLDEPRAGSRVLGVEDGRVGPRLPLCLALGPHGLTWVSLSSQLDHAVLRRLDRPEVALPLDSDSEFLGDTYTFDATGGLVAWGCSDGVVVVADLSAVRDKLARLQDVE